MSNWKPLKNPPPVDPHNYEARFFYPGVPWGLNFIGVDWAFGDDAIVGVAVEQPSPCKDDEQES